MEIYKETLEEVSHENDENKKARIIDKIDEEDVHHENSDRHQNTFTPGTFTDPSQMELLHAKLNIMMKEMEKIKICQTEMKNKLDQAPSTSKHKQITQPPSRNVFDPDKIMIAKHSKCVEELTTNLPNYVEIPGGIKCKPCAAEVATVDENNAKLVGVFKYENINTDSSTQSRKFRDLKVSVVDHLNTKTHLKNTQQLENLEEEKKIAAPRNQEIGMRLARNAYKAIKMN